jgi:hypothetical protein
MKKFSVEKHSNLVDKKLQYTDEGIPSYGRSLQSSKENIKHLKHEISSLVGHCSLLGSGSRFPIQIRSGYASQTLVKYRPLQGTPP